MKIEIGESLFYSWLRHVKDCQIVQTNWKVSPQWEFGNADKLQRFMNDADALFQQKYGYAVFKQNTMSRLIRQGECDVLGISLQQDGTIEYYAIDVAFHENGLQYGSATETVERIIKKCLRTAICLRGCLNAGKATIVFASPKINPAQVAALVPCIEDMNALLHSCNLEYQVRLIANEDFETQVLQPILLLSEDVADTGELFMRSYQMYRMFTESAVGKTHTEKQTAPCRHSQPVSQELPAHDDSFAELKVGKIANTILRNRLESGFASEDEVLSMQEAEYSKKVFGINYPLLVPTGSNFERVRYYSRSLFIRGVEYALCSQWFETPANNDRPHLLAWLDAHSEPT